MATITVKAKKTLINDEGQTCFVKGKEYTTKHDWYYSSRGFSESTPLINETGEVHTPGNWFKHFSIVKK